MIFHKDPIAYDASVDQSDLDETLLAFAVSDKIPLTLAVVHPLQPDNASKTAAAICKQFIQDRFLQFNTWLPHHSFSWSVELAKQLLEIKQWLLPKEETLYNSISQMIWLNWFVVVHPRTAFLLSIGEIHTHLLRQREWQSWWEVPVDFSAKDDIGSHLKTSDLPSINVRQMYLRHGDILLIANQSDPLQFALNISQKDCFSKTEFAKATMDRMNQQIDQLHLTKPQQSIGLVQVL